MAERLRFCNLVKQPIDAAVKVGFGSPFRHQIVVIGIEPLRHFHREILLVTPRQGEIFRQAQLLGIEFEPRRNRTQQGQRAQHLVVPGKVADGDDIHASLRLHRPMTGAQGATSFLQCRGLRLAAPE